MCDNNLQGHFPPGKLEGRPHFGMAWVVICCSQFGTVCIDWQGTKGGQGGNKGGQRGGPGVVVALKTTQAGYHAPHLATLDRATNILQAA